MLQTCWISRLSLLAVLASSSLACGDDAGDSGGGEATDSAGEDGSDGAADGNEDADAGSDAGSDDGQDADAYAEALRSASWADDVSIEVQDDVIVLSSDGYPNHDVLEAYAVPDSDDPIAVVATDTTFTIPRTPTWSDTVTDTGLGTIGFAVSGAVYFNPYEGDGVSVALDSNFDVGGVPFLDACNGHPLPSETTYHYHGVPYCITDVLDTAGEHSALIGVLLDGYPVYGPLGEGGEVPADLDECSGHDGPTSEFPDGIYHYHLTEVSPYSVTCFHGEADAAGGGMPDGPPGGVVE